MDWVMVGEVGYDAFRLHNVSTGLEFDGLK